MISQKKLRTIGIINEHDYARDKGRIMIAYRAQDLGRGGHGAAWYVWGRGIKTDPQGPWYNHGDKHFLVLRDRAGVLAQAQAWAAKHYGIKVWAKTPFGSYMDAAFVAERNAELAAVYAGRDTVTCSLCHRPASAKSAHRHQDEWIGDKCCWDDRLRSSE